MSDTSPTSTVESKNTDDFGGPTKKFASTGTLYPSDTSRNKPTSSIEENVDSMPTSSIPAEPNSSGDANHQSERGNLANFKMSLYSLQMIFQNLNK